MAKFPKRLAAVLALAVAVGIIVPATSAEAATRKTTPTVVVTVQSKDYFW